MTDRPQNSERWCGACAGRSGSGKLFVLFPQRARKQPLHQIAVWVRRVDLKRQFGLPGAAPRALPTLARAIERELGRSS